MKRYFIRYQGMFWRPNGSGYTYLPIEAGIFFEGEYGIKDSDLKISDRGDYAVEIGQYLRDQNYTSEKFDDMRYKIDYLQSFLIEAPR